MKEYELPKRDISQMYVMASEMSQKTLPSYAADERVALILRCLKREAELYAEQDKKCDARWLIPGTKDGSVSDPVAYQNEKHELANTLVKIKLPKPITKDMLPAELGTQPENLKERSRIMFALGVMFEIPDDSE